MKKAIKILTKVLKVIGLLLFLKILVLALLIPYGRNSEKDMPEFGISYNKVVLKGVNILFGTDSGPNFIVDGVSLIEEMELLREAGLTRYNILKSATFNAVKNLNRENLDNINATADFLVLNENPLENSNVFSSRNMIFTKSKYYSSNVLSEIRNIASRSNKN